MECNKNVMSVSDFLIDIIQNTSFFFFYYLIIGDSKSA